MSKRIFSKVVVVILLMGLLLQIVSCANKQSSGNPQETHGLTIEKLSFQSIKKPDFPFVPTKYTASVTSYTVKADLSNIANLSQFPNLTEIQKQMLVRNNFVVTPSGEPQFNILYESNKYNKIPSFITTDSILQVYHVYYDYALRFTEEQKLIPKVEQLTDNMLNQLISQYNSVTDSQTKKAMEESIAFFAIAQQLLEKPLPNNVPKASKDIAAIEVENIKNLKIVNTSYFDFEDFFYSNFLVRGHYVNSKALGNYFKAMMWYGTFPYKITNNMDDAKNINACLSSMLVSNALMTLPEDKGKNLWEDVYSPTAFFVGSADDVNPLDVMLVMNHIYKQIDINKLNDKNALLSFYNEIKSKDTAKIKREDDPVEIRFMGQRYVADSDILQKLTNDDRTQPSGLDMAAVFGSVNAKKYVDEYLKPTSIWPDYTIKFNETKEYFSKLPESTWQSNMYYGWLWSLKPLYNKPGADYPVFMQNDAWYDKALNTSLGSWAELRHDTILYSKQGSAECGAEEEQELYGYVEPNIELYDRLLWLTNYSKENLKMRDLLSKDFEDKANSITNFLGFLITCSKKELNNQPLTVDELANIRTYGGWLESICSYVEPKGVNDEVLENNLNDQSMATIADVFKVIDISLMEGVGNTSQILVITPSNGKLYLTRGAVFDYFEFVSEEKLTDAKWQDQLTNKTNPPRPEWTKSFVDLKGTTEFKNP